MFVLFCFICYHIEICSTLGLIGEGGEMILIPLKAFNKLVKRKKVSWECDKGVEFKVFCKKKKSSQVYFIWPSFVLVYFTWIDFTWIYLTQLEFSLLEFTWLNLNSLYLNLLHSTWFYFAWFCLILICFFISCLDLLNCEGLYNGLWFY